jgi:hypothetical protein
MPRAPASEGAHPRPCCQLHRTARHRKASQGTQIVTVPDHRPHCRAADRMPSRRRLRSARAAATSRANHTGGITRPPADAARFSSRGQPEDVTQVTRCGSHHVRRGRYALWVTPCAPGRVESSASRNALRITGISCAPEQIKPCQVKRSSHAAGRAAQPGARAAPAVRHGLQLVKRVGLTSSTQISSHLLARSLSPAPPSPPGLGASLGQPCPCMVFGNQRCFS